MRCIALIATSLVVALGFADAAAAQQPAAYVHSNASTAWDEEAFYTDQLLVLFPGGFDDLAFETVDPAALFAEDRLFVYLEGSDNMTDALEVFLDANRAAAESWVKKGGRLYINAAPNVGDGLTTVFGVNIAANELADDAVAASPIAPFLMGPVAISTASFLGDSASHAAVVGGKLRPLLRNELDHLTLASCSKSKGRVFIGGLTTPNWWDPDPDAEAMRANTLAFFCGRQLDPEDVKLKLTLRQVAPGDPANDSLSLDVKNLALGDLDFAGANFTVDIDGYVVAGTLDAKAKFTTTVGSSKTTVTVKSGRNGSIKVTQSKVDIAPSLGNEFIAPIDVEVEIGLPMTITVGGLTFQAVLPTLYKGKSDGTSCAKSHD